MHRCSVSSSLNKGIDAASVPHYTKACIDTASVHFLAIRGSYVECAWEILKYQ